MVSELIGLLRQAPLDKQWEFTGVLNLNKPPKLTSRQAGRLRETPTKCKQGRPWWHTSIRMPPAYYSSVLGDGTKLFEALQVGTKEYEGTLTLGITTDTLDANGQITKITDASQITPDQIRSVCQQFVGEIEQMPPMFSAVKYKGKPLYKLARRGLEVKRRLRQVFVESIELLSLNIPEVRFRVVCSKGTYIRALAADIGAALGVWCPPFRTYPHTLWRIQDREGTYIR